MELDAKIMVDAFHLAPLAIDEFGSIIRDCQGLIANRNLSFNL